MSKKVKARSPWVRITGRYFYFSFPLAGFLFGKFLDDAETCRMTMYRDKSALYGAIEEEEKYPPSWPRSIVDDVRHILGIEKKKPKPKPKDPELEEFSEPPK